MQQVVLTKAKEKDRLYLTDLGTQRTVKRLLPSSRAWQQIPWLCESQPTDSNALS